MYTEKDVVDSLLQRIYNIVAAPDTVTNIPTARAHLSICMPGIPLNPSALDFGFTTMSADQVERAADFSEFANIVPLWGGSWRPSGRKLTGEYKKVIDQPILPVTELSAAEKKKYEEAKALLWVNQKVQDPLTGRVDDIPVPSIWQQRYDEYEKLHRNAVMDYLDAQAKYLAHINEPGQPERWAQLKPILENSIRTALSKWEAAGKRKVEEARGLIGNLDGRGLQASWADRRARFDTYKKGAQVGDFWLTKYYPNKFWEDAAGWFSILLTHNEVHTVTENEQTSWGGGGGFSAGLWSVGADVSHDSQKSRITADTSAVQVAFELAQVPLLRGWLDAEVFESRSWKFDSNLVSASENLSDGKIPPSGTMPMYPTAMLLARNVKIAFDKTSTVSTTAMETIRGSVSVGWGPFSARANYYHHWDKSTFDFVEDAAGISIPGMQVIGFICRLVETCPNPDPALHWPT